MSKKMKFKHASIYVLLLMFLNIIIIGLNSFIRSDSFVYLANVIAISLVFPFVVLYIEKNERFNLKRYIKFSVSTFICLFVICNLFIYKFI